MKISHIEHLGIAVNSIEEALPYYENVLGLKCYNVETVEDQKVKTAFLKCGDTKIELLEPTGPDSTIAKFIENRFITQLEVNKQLLEFQEGQKRNWSNEEEFVRSLYNQIIETDYYKEYMADPTSSYSQDRELWRKIYKNIICNNERLESLLEDMSLYWNDDKYIVDTFVLKTIKRFDESKGADQELLPEFKDEEDREFAHRLFRNTLLNADYYRKLISDNTKNWEFNRIALMDLVIMQIALAEIQTFPNIPLSVSLNEYVDIAKMYSTPRSGSYVNGLLDSISKKLIAEKKIIKK